MNWPRLCHRNLNLTRVPKLLEQETLEMRRKRYICHWYAYIGAVYPLLTIKDQWNLKGKVTFPDSSLHWSNSYRKIRTYKQLTALLRETCGLTSDDRV
jgi:hypothetical protein